MTKLTFDVISAYRGRTVATAESCTGGLVGAMLTEVPGASAVYKGGVISYWSEVKEQILGVSSDTLSVFGAVSEETAMQMARGIRETLKSDVAVSVTGLAGPEGDGSDHPVGTVYVGFANYKQVFAREYHFSGNRSEIRQQAAEAALGLLLEHQ